MDPPKEQDTSIRAIRRLTISVWALVLVLVVNTALQLLTGFLPAMFA